MSYVPPKWPIPSDVKWIEVNGYPMAYQDSGAGEPLVLTSPSTVISPCLMAPSRRTRIRLAIRSLMGDQIDPAHVGGARLGRRREPRRTGDRGERGRREAEPVLAGELDLAELVADHQLLDGGQGTRLGDGLDVVAIAGVRRDAPGRRVRVGQQAVGLELGEDAANRGAGHAEAIASTSACCRPASRS